VALSVSRSTGLSLRVSSPLAVLSRRCGEPAQTQVCATAPLALPGALPIPDHARRERHALLRWCPDFPPALVARPD